MLETASMEHKFKLSVFQPTDPKNFIKFLRKEIQLLRTSLPDGIHIKGFEDRMVCASIQFINPPPQ
jgi:ubiquitin-conjugating enzyme E2 O